MRGAAGKMLRMSRPALARKREIWVPTLWGWSVLLLIAVAAMVMIARHLYPFLAEHQPSGARLLVVEGWLDPEELDQAVLAFHEGRYEQIITSGGPVPPDIARRQRTSYAELAREHLIHRGVPQGKVFAVPAPASAQDRTYLSAVMVRNWLARARPAIDALDVFSQGVHSRRTRLLYRLAFGPDVRVGVRSAMPNDYEPDFWWATSSGAKTVIAETLSWAWTVAFFHPNAPGSHAETWGGAAR